MARDSKGTSNERKYPEFYEKAVPIALVIIFVAIIVVLLVVLAISLRLLPGATY